MQHFLKHLHGMIIYNTIFWTTAGVQITLVGLYTLYNGLYRESPPEKGTFFRLQVNESRLGFLLLKYSVYERVGKSVVLVENTCKAQKS